MGTNTEETVERAAMERAESVLGQPEITSFKQAGGLDLFLLLIAFWYSGTG